MALDTFCKVHLPYCLEQLEDGSYVVLNREYKPVGFNTYASIDYSRYPIASRFRRLSQKTAARISHDGSHDLKRIFLYDDGCSPSASAYNMKQYLRRLENLAKLTIEEPSRRPPTYTLRTWRP